MLKKIVNSVLALLILLTSTSFTVNMHFCHEQLIDIAVLAPAKSCCNADVSEGQSCGFNDLTQTSHCKDKSISIETIGDFITSDFSFNFENEQQFELPWLSLSTLKQNNTEQNTFRSIRDFKIPPPYSDVDLSEIQDFLL